MSPLTTETEIVLTTFLFLLTLLPSVYLRYLPFRSILTEKTKRQLFYGYAIIFLAETVGSLLLFFFNIVPYSFHTFKLFYFFFGFLPYFLLNLCLIRPCFAQHIFILGIQFILAGAISGIAMSLILLQTGEDGFFSYFSLYCGIYLIIYLMSFPFVLPFFREIFLRFSSIRTDRFWLYIAFLPLLMTFHDVFYSLGADPVSLRYLVARLMLFASGILIALATWRGLEHILRQALMGERNLELLRRMHSFGEYTRSLQDKQMRLATVRHDLRHNVKLLASLISRGDDESAMQLIANMNRQIDATRAEQFAANPLLNSALAIYVQQARAKELPIEVMADVPASFEAEVDLSLVICNLLENAIHAEEEEPKGERAIRLLARPHNEVLYLSVSNRRTAPVRLGASGLPESKAPLPGHGYGTRSLLAFTEKYDANFFTDQADGWFTIFLHLPLKKV